MTTNTLSRLNVLEQVCGEPKPDGQDDLQDQDQPLPSAEAVELAGEDLGEEVADQDQQEEDLDDERKVPPSLARALLRGDAAADLGGLVAHAITSRRGEAHTRTGSRRTAAAGMIDDPEVMPPAWRSR